MLIIAALLAQSAVPLQVPWTMATYSTSDCSDAGTVELAMPRPTSPAIPLDSLVPTDWFRITPTMCSAASSTSSVSGGWCDLSTAGSPVYREDLHMGSTDCSTTSFPTAYPSGMCVNIAPGMSLMYTCFDSRKPKTVNCPPGWTAGWGAKCMKLTGPATHERCAAACGMNASLACIQSQEDQELARLVSPSAISTFVWLGEYQYPFEPTIEAGAKTPYMGAPYNGQPGWGTCSNGQHVSYQATFWGGYLGYPQPNNYNLGEDCMAWSPAGYADEVCTSRYQCLCEWPSQTSAVYTSTHRPALTRRAHDAFAVQSGEVWR